MKELSLNSNTAGLADTMANMFSKSRSTPAYTSTEYSVADFDQLMNVSLTENLTTSQQPLSESGFTVAMVLPEGQSITTIQADTPLATRRKRRLLKPITTGSNKFGRHGKMRCLRC